MLKAVIFFYAYNYKKLIKYDILVIYVHTVDIHNNA